MTDKVLWIFTSVTIALLFALLWFTVSVVVDESEQWQEFVKTHNCKVVGKQSGSIGFGNAISPSGKVALVTTYEHDKVGYLCNDGVTYWR